MSSATIVPASAPSKIYTDLIPIIEDVCARYMTENAKRRPPQSAA